MSTHLQDRLDGLIIEVSVPSGALVVSDIINGTRESATYFGYTEDEAKAEFLDSHNRLY